MTTPLNFQDLLHIIYENDIKQLIELKRNDVDFTITDKHDNNNLIIAYSGYGYEEKYTPEEMINFLLECGIDINVQMNERGSKLSALHMAVANNHFKIIKALIEHGANIEPRDNNGNTPLTKIVFDYRGEEERLKIINYLLSKGSSLDTKNNHGISARETILTTGEGIDEEYNKKIWDLRFLLSAS